MMAKTFNFGKTLADQKSALQALKKLLDAEDKYENGTLRDFYDCFVFLDIKPLKKLTSGKAATFYTSTRYVHMATAVKNLKERGQHITIHKSKGNEFDNVMLILPADDKGVFKEATELRFLLQPNLVGTGIPEDNRVLYVAVSRARNFLAINIPIISSATEQKFRSLRIDVQPV